MRCAYIRISTADQKTDRQEAIMQELDVDRVFIEKQSGKDTNRPVLKEMMDYLRDGDILVVESISRFARNTRDLLLLTDQLKEKGVEFVSVKESIDTNTPTGKFMLTVFGAVAELERQYIRERQREGIDIARKKGKYRGRNKIVPDEKAFAMVYNQWKQNGEGSISARVAMKLLGLKPNTFYRRVKEYEDNKVIDFG